MDQLHNKNFTIEGLSWDDAERNVDVQILAYKGKLVIFVVEQG
jgi:hypothetical protein